MKKKRNKNDLKHLYGDFDLLQKIRIWMEYHKDEVFTPEFMEELAQKFLNYYYVRKKIKELFPKILQTDIKNNIAVIPSDYESIYK